MCWCLHCLPLNNMLAWKCGTTALLVHWLAHVMKLGQRQLAQMQVSGIRFYPEFPQTMFKGSQYSWIVLGSLTKCQSKDSDIITVFARFHMGLFEHGGTTAPHIHLLLIIAPLNSAMFGGIETHVFLCHAILLPYGGWKKSCTTKRRVETCWKLKPYKWWDKPPINWWLGFLPSTVCFLFPSLQAMSTLNLEPLPPGPEPRS